MGYIRCIACHGDKPITQFGEKQLAKAKKNKGLPRCLSCSTQKEPTLVCSACDLEKPVGAFTKSQRRNKEQATCIVCVSGAIEEENRDEKDNLDAATVLPIVIELPCIKAEIPNSGDDMCLSYKIYDFSPSNM